MQESRQFMCVAAIAFLMTGSLKAAESDNAKLQAAIIQSGDRYAKAFADRDSKALGKLFTAEAEYVDSDGTIFHGRDAIEAEFSASLEDSPEGTLSIEVLSIRSIAAGVVVEDGISTFSPTEAGTSLRTRYAATHVKQDDGNWLIASVREIGSSVVTAHDRLQALAWLAGQWREEVDGTVINTEWKWSEDGNFLLSDFSVQEADSSEWKGTHRIGWDAERKQFRSWIFDSHGGASDGWWRPHDNGTWTIILGGVDAEGTRRSSILTYQQDGGDAIAVSQQQRIQGGMSLPDRVHRIVRQPPGTSVGKGAKKI